MDLFTEITYLRKETITFQLSYLRIIVLKALKFVGLNNELEPESLAEELFDHNIVKGRLYCFTKLNAAHGTSKQIAKSNCLSKVVCDYRTQASTRDLLPQST